MPSSPLNLSNSPKFPFSNNANFHQHGQIFLLLPESAAIISWPLAFTGKGGWFPKFFFFNVLISIQRSRAHCNFPSYTLLDSVPIHPPLPSLYCPLPSAVPAPSTFMTYIFYDTLVPTTCPFRSPPPPRSPLFPFHAPPTIWISDMRERMIFIFLNLAYWA